MIVITGASDGLGHELAKVFKDAGRKVVNVSRRKCSVADVNLLHDLSKTSEVKAVIKEILAIDEPLEAFINNAGIWTEEAFGKMTEEAVEKAWSVNAKAPLLLVSGLIDRIKRDEADVVNIVSNAGRHGSKGWPAYTATKWAERGFTDSLRLELKDTMSRVIGAYPGGISTGIFYKDTGDDYTKNGEYWMEPAALALCIKQLLDLPKGIEVTEISFDRKKQFKK